MMDEMMWVRIEFRTGAIVQVLYPYDEAEDYPHAGEWPDPHAADHGGFGFIEMLMQDDEYGGFFVLPNMGMGDIALIKIWRHE